MADMKNNIPYTKPSITALEINYASDAIQNGWGAKCYEYINKFEDAFKKHLGVEHAIATSSCTVTAPAGQVAMSAL